VKSSSFPRKHLRKIEILANKGFQAYLRHYFDVGVISTYVWEVDNENWWLGVFVNKTVDTRSSGGIQGSISCSDVCQVTKLSGQQLEYTLVSSAIVTIDCPCRIGGPVRLSGSVSDQHVVKGTAKDPIDHLVTIGNILEESADRFVERIRSISVSRMKDILTCMKVDTAGGPTDEAIDKVAAGLARNV
jgi:hypothetical protein